MKYVVVVRIFRFLKECIFVPLADKQAKAKKDLLTDHLVVCNKLMSIYIFHAWYICLYSTDIALIAQSNSFNHLLYRGSFYGQWEKWRFGTVQTFTIPWTTHYLIKAWGAQGETLSYDYGDYPGTYYGGKGVFKEGKFRLNKGNRVKYCGGTRRRGFSGG